MKQVCFLMQFFILLGVICAEENEGTVNANTLNVRITPGTSAKDCVVATLQKGDKIKITGEKDGWYSIVAPDSCSIWIFGNFLKGNVVEKEVKLRSGPGVTYPPYAVTAKPGQKLEIERKTNDNWVKIKPFAGINVWVSAEFVSCNRPKNGHLRTELAKTDKLKSEIGGDDKKAESSLETSNFHTDKITKSKSVNEEKKDEKAQANEAVSSKETKDKKSPKNKKFVTAEGIIVKLEPTGDKTISYALCKRKKDNEVEVLYYLRTPGMNLDKWYNQKVKLSGTIETIPTWKYSIIRVENVDSAW